MHVCKDCLTRDGHIETRESDTDSENDDLQVSSCNQYVIVGNFETFSTRKALNGNSLLFAHPSTLNNGKPIGYRDASLDVLDEATPYVGISQTPNVGSTQPMDSLDMYVSVVMYFYS